MVKCLVAYVTKCMSDVILKTISIKHKIVNFKKSANWCKVPKHCTVINSLLNSSILCPYLESCFCSSG